MESQKLEGIDAVVHLAGENIGQRWNEQSKARIMTAASKAPGHSVKPWRRCLRRLGVWSAPPPSVITVIVATSCLRRKAGRVRDFLPMCALNGKRPRNLQRRGASALRTRALVSFWIARTARSQKCCLPFRLGAGGKMGSGRQYWSWVAIEDVVGAIKEALTDQSLQGPVNTTAPNPVTNAEFTSTLARVLKRPAILPMPAFAARVAVGEMADALLLSSARVAPTRLIAAGYQFQYPDLEGALRHTLAQ